MKAFGKYDLPENTTHVAKGRHAGCYYKTSDNELWRFVDDCGNECYSDIVINMEYQSHLGIKEASGYIINGNADIGVDIDSECKERVGQVFSLPFCKSFISSGFIKKDALGNGSGFKISYLNATVTPEMILEALEQFVPDFTKHKDCDIAVIRDIVEQYRNKIKQLQESKK